MAHEDIISPIKLVTAIGSAGLIDRKHALFLVFQIDQRIAEAPTQIDGLCFTGKLLIQLPNMCCTDFGLCRNPKAQAVMFQIYRASGQEKSKCVILSSQPQNWHI
jgi:hypothetical protein